MTRACRTDHAASEVELCAREFSRQITLGNKEIKKKCPTFFRICLHEKFVSGAVIDEGGEASRFVQGNDAEFPGFFFSFPEIVEIPGMVKISR